MIEDCATLIKFYTQINTPKSTKPLSIKYSDIDNYNFKNGFIEVLENLEYVHPYFDFDSITNAEEFEIVYQFLESISTVFGNYTYGGYTTDEEIADAYDILLVSTAKHICSIHVIFYEVKISCKDMMNIMKYDNKTGSYLYKNVCKYCDPNVYKLSSRQLFRHTLSDKIFTPDNIVKTAGIIAFKEHNKPHAHIVQINGSERLITNNEWKSIFYKEDAELTSDNDNDKTDSQISCDNLEMLDNGLINLNAEELLELINNFTPNHDNLSRIISNLFHSPYDKEFLRSVISNWYFSIHHDNLTTVDSYLDKYYEKCDTNKWFFSIIKHLPDNIRYSYRSKFIDKYYDSDAEFLPHDNSITLRTLQTKDYTIKNGTGIRVNEFMSDIKRLFVCINDPVPIYISKKYDSTVKSFSHTMLNADEFKKCLKDIIIGKYYKVTSSGAKILKSVTAYDIYNSSQFNKNYIKKDGLAFYDNNPNIFNCFTGYKYTDNDNVNMDIIQPYLTHILEVIANNRTDVYEYILNWYSYIIQNPSKKTTVAILLTGSEGCGKNTFTDVLAEILGIYANKNLSDISNITGKFNSSLEDKRLIVCNELSNSDATNIYVNNDVLKTIITDDTIDIHQKYMKPRRRENVVNLILVSNHRSPIKITNNDRRYLVLECSDIYRNNLKHFQELQATFTEDFYSNLYNFFRTRDISNFNPRFIPVTEEKLSLIEDCKNHIQLFYEDNIDKFNEGYQTTSCYTAYKLYAETRNYKVLSDSAFGKHIKEFCTKIKKRVGNNERIFIYKTKA